MDKVRITAVFETEVDLLSDYDVDTEEQALQAMKQDYEDSTILLPMLEMAIEDGEGYDVIIEKVKEHEL